MSDNPEIETPKAGSEAQGQQPSGTAAILRDLVAAAEVIETGAFDLAGQAHADTVSELIRVAGDLRGLIDELAPRAAR